ncbi:MAG: transglycosylase SLT domain-containing protein, partial [Acetobacteraceae bacterium]
MPVGAPLPLGMIRRELIRLGMTLLGVIRLGMVWLGVIVPGTVRLRVILPAMILLAAAGTALPARADNPMAFVRANEWAKAAATVAGAADPVARKLVTFYRLLAPGAATPDQISAFMSVNPDWPDQALLARRRQQALVTDDDPADAAAQCAQGPITLPAALAHCADALAATGDKAAAARAARRAWAAGFAAPAQLPAFLHRWSGVFTPDDEWSRFRRLLSAGHAAAAAEIERLAPTRQPAARAWLALQTNAPDAAALVHALPAAARPIPDLVLAQARWLRHAGRDTEALGLWRASGFAAELAVPPGQRGAFGNERAILARTLLADGNAAGAFASANDTAQTAPAAVASAGFLAGFIALTQLHDPALAATCFHRLTTVSRAAITEARAHYWLGRAAAAAGADPTDEYRAAAAWPTTFYGQLAARALGESPAALLDAAQDPAFTRTQAWTFTGHELVRAALLLTAWNEPGRARAFLLRMAEVAPDPAEQALAARLALALDLPETAVSIARRMGLEGRMLPRVGWPMPVVPPAGPPAGTVDPAVTLALIRQESSFDRGAVSPAGALGLMQLLPGTAAQVARRLGAPVTEVALTGDALRNMQLGTAYLAQLLARYDGCLPLAVAAYNAGPHRVDRWLVENGDPRPHASAMVDWIELIPYGETRNYVQRVLENVIVYLARRGTQAPALTAQWMPTPARQAAAGTAGAGSGGSGSAVTGSGGAGSVA